MGRTALHEIVSSTTLNASSNDLALIRALIISGADVTIKDEVLQQSYRPYYLPGGPSDAPLFVIYDKLLLYATYG